MENSILKSVKKALGLDADYTEFDQDIIMSINSALGTVTQLGVGPETGFEIQDDTAVWDTLLGGNPKLNGVKNFVYLSVRLVFDPPATSFQLGSIEKQLQEMAWRIEAAANPPAPVIVDPNVVDIWGDPVNGTFA